VSASGHVPTEAAEGKGAGMLELIFYVAVFGFAIGVSGIALLIIDHAIRGPF